MADKRFTSFFDEYPELKDYDKKQYKSHLVKRENHIVTITFNRPEIRNASSGDMWEFIRILDCVKQDRDARALVITGAGTAFHAGANIKGWSAGQEGEAEGGRREYESERWESAKLGFGSMPMMNIQYNMHKPSIAMVNGPARGMGFDHALTCDFVVASERASFAMSYIVQGLSPFDGGIWFLTRRCGYTVAMDLCITGRVVDAEEALRLNIVNKVVPHDKLEEETYKLADLVANHRSPLAVRMCRHYIYQALNQSFLDSLDDAHIGAQFSSISPHSKEAMKAWNEKREPDFEDVLYKE